MKQGTLPTEQRKVSSPAAAPAPDDLDLAHEDPTPVATRRAGTLPRRDPFDVAWRLLSSVRFAFFLILALAAASLAGTLLIQAPAEIAGDPAEYQDWLARIRPTFGALTDPLSALSLFTIFSSFWFRALLGLLSLSIVVCTLNRWPGIRRTLTAPRIRLAPGFFRAVPFHTEIPVPGGDLAVAATAVAAALRSRGYRVLQEREGTVSHAFADRYRYSQLGTFALHGGLVLMLVGALWGSMAGYSDRAFTIPEGATRAVGFGTDLTVKLDAFADEYYPDGPPKDYRSELVLYQGATEVRRQTIRVNEPLEYQGWRFHQSFFGPAAVIDVQDTAGRTLFSGGVALAWRTKGDRPMGSFRLPEHNLTVYVVGPSAGGWDDVIKAGELRLEIFRGTEARPLALETIAQGQPTTAAGLTFTFLRERQFSGLQVVNDPGSPLVYTAWMLAVFGLTVVFYFPYRRLWARCQQEPDGTLRVFLGATGRRELGLAQEFAAVERAVRAHVLAQGGTHRV